MRIVWSAEARRNLLAIALHIAQDSPGRALAYADKIELKTTSLKRFPALGRMVPELRDEPEPPREIWVDDYRIVYRIAGKTVFILTVFHGRRQFLARL